MSSEANTLPTTQTILESIEALATEMRAGFSAVNQRLSSIEHQLEQMDMRMDGIESIALQARSEVLGLRKEFKEFRSRFDDPARQP